MSHASLRVIREEYAALAAMLRSLQLMVERRPKKNVENFLSVLRAMLFYVDEFPERLHHTKDTALLFSKAAPVSLHAAGAVKKLDRDHARGEAAVRELQHLLLAWELVGETRRGAYEGACLRDVSFYLDHMQLEESVILPEAEPWLSPEEWQQLDDAFASNRDPMFGTYPADPAYQRLFANIVLKARHPLASARTPDHGG